MSGQNTLVVIAEDAQVQRPAHLYNWQFYRDTAIAGGGTYKAMDQNGIVEIVGGPGAGFGTITGGGSVNFIPKFSPVGTNIIDSSLFDNGNIGYGTILPNAVAAFDIVSTTKGMLFPRMTTAQRDAIVVGAATDGLFIYNISTEKFNFWNQTLGIWESIDTSTGGDVSGSGTTNFIPRWTDGPNSILGDSIIRDNGVVAAVNRALIATSMFAIQGADSLGVNYSLDVYNSTPTRTFGVGNDGYILAGNAAGNLTIGFDSFFDTITSGNTFIGVGIGGAVTAQENTAVGQNALGSLTTGGAVGRNTAVGKDALFSVTTGNLNTAVGFEALYNNVGGIENNAFGRRALYSVNNNYNNAFGSRCLTLCTGGENTAMGDAALASMTSGDNNVAFGLNAGVSNIVGDRNVFLGYSAGFFETGSDKLFIDDRARADEANGRISSLIYGQFNGNPLVQGLVFNAILYLKDTAAPFNYWSIVNTAGVLVVTDTGSPVAPF